MGEVIDMYQRKSLNETNALDERSLDDVLHGSGYDLNNSQIAPMGYAWVDNGQVNVVGSDRPYEHAKEAIKFDKKARGYFSSSEGQEFMGWLEARAGNVVDIKYGSADLPQDDAVAALVYDGLARKGLIVGNNGNGRSFEDRVRDMANMYEGLDPESCEEMVLKHEKIHQYVHATGDAYNDELGVESMLEEHFSEKRDEAKADYNFADFKKYSTLVNVVKSRKEAIKNGKTQHKKAA
jgi:hypothetical protein